jgi:transposase
MRRAPPVSLTEDERATLLRCVRRPSTPQKRALRARIILAAAAGEANEAIARRLGCSRPTVGHWRAAFAAKGLAGLEEQPKPGRPPRYSAAKVTEILSATLRAPAAATHWSARRLAPHVGVSHMTVHRIWRQHQLQPHRVETFKYSRDPQLVAKVCDLVGLYLDPPTDALVLCVDEKPQIQALERTRPALPLRPGTPATQTHDYKRNGTIDLFAALVVATGEVVTQFHPRHRHQEFLKFLRLLVRRFPARDLHVVMDNLSAHKTPEVRRWLQRHPRVHVHFTPTSGSWMNQVETWFSILTRQQLRRGSYESVAELMTAIERFITSHNQSPRPFAWTKTADQILAKAIKNKSIYVTEH